MAMSSDPKFWIFLFWLIGSFFFFFNFFEVIKNVYTPLMWSPSSLSCIDVCVILFFFFQISNIIFYRWRKKNKQIFCVKNSNGHPILKTNIIWINNSFGIDDNQTHEIKESCYTRDCWIKPKQYQSFSISYDFFFLQNVSQHTHTHTHISMKRIGK